MIQKRDELIFKLIQGVINRWDPIGNSPEWEYDGEVKGLVKQIPRIKSERDAALSVQRIFSSSFDATSYPFSVCEKVGRELFNVLRENKLI